MGVALSLRNQNNWKFAYVLYRVHTMMYRKMVRILIIIVLGALLLAGLYALFGDVVLPTLEQRIQQMFNFVG